MAESSPVRPRLAIWGWPGVQLPREAKLGGQPGWESPTAARRYVVAAAPAPGRPVSFQRHATVRVSLALGQPRPLVGVVDPG